MTYDLVGTIYVPSGVILTDKESNEHPEMVAVDGYHVNMIDVDMELVAPYVVTVNTPSRVFAGRDDTVHLKFVDRAEWLDLGIEVVEEML